MSRVALGTLALLAACAHATTPPTANPPFPLPGAEPHVEPDLVGAVHTVRKGETLFRIARTYGVEPGDLMEINDLHDARALRPGMELFVPGARRPLEVPPAPPGAAEPEEETLPRRPPQAAEARLRWPLQGVLYSRYGVRQGQHHDGIDISAPEGTPVGAAADGTVVYAGEQSGYGQIVILRHDAGLLTLYAHASRVLVREGDRVTAGQPIARVGQSGRTTGPHLHFEVRQGARPRNPLLFLP